MGEEQNRDFSFYIPQPSELHLAQHMLEKKYAPFFSAKDILTQAEEKISRRILSALEEITGTTLYGLDASSWLAPVSWTKVLQLLYKEKVIDEPRFWCAPCYNDEPKFYMFGLTQSSHDLFGGMQMRTMGFSFDPDEARGKAIGEFLERYALLPLPQYHKEKISVAYLKKKRKRFLDPASVAGAFQRGLIHDDAPPEEKEFWWVRGRNLCTGKETFLPAQLVFWNYNSGTFSEPYIREANTNGAAGMFSLSKAVLAGAYELIQRDAFLVFWLNKLAPPRINPASIENKEIKQILAAIYRYGLDVAILNVTTDIGVPAFVSTVLDGAGDSKQISLGGGCDLSAEEALRASLMEALSVHHSLRRDKSVFKLPEPYRPFEERIGQKDRLSLWADPDMFPRFKWFISGKEYSLDARKATYKIPTGGDSLSIIMEKCKALGEGYEIYYYEANNPILRRLGYHAVRVIIPALVPLYLTETYAPLNARRLKQVPAQLGYMNVAFPERLPHPFP